MKIALYNPPCLLRLGRFLQIAIALQCDIVCLVGTCPRNKNNIHDGNSTQQVLGVPSLAVRSSLPRGAPCGWLWVGSARNVGTCLRNGNNIHDGNSTQQVFGVPSLAVRSSFPRGAPGGWLWVGSARNGFRPSGVPWALSAPSVPAPVEHGSLLQPEEAERQELGDGIASQDCGFPPAANQSSPIIGICSVHGGTPGALESCHRRTSSSTTSSSRHGLDESCCGGSGVWPLLPTPSEVADAQPGQWPTCAAPHTTMRVNNRSLQQDDTCHSLSHHFGLGYPETIATSTTTTTPPFDYHAYASTAPQAQSKHHHHNTTQSNDEQYNNCSTEFIRAQTKHTQRLLRRLSNKTKQKAKTTRRPAGAIHYQNNELLHLARWTEYPVQHQASEEKKGPHLRLPFVWTTCHFKKSALPNAQDAVQKIIEDYKKSSQEEKCYILRVSLTVSAFTESSLYSHWNPVQPSEPGIQGRKLTSRTHGKKTGSLAERASELALLRLKAFSFAEPANFVDPNIMHAASLCRNSLA